MLPGAITNCKQHQQEGVQQRWAQGDHEGCWQRPEWLPESRWACHGVKTSSNQHDPV